MNFSIKKKFALDSCHDDYPVESILDLINSKMVLKPRQKFELTLILTELYLNALDHGILQIDKSKMRDTSEYICAKKTKLEAVQAGMIEFVVDFDEFTANLQVTISDTGPGFAVPANFEVLDNKISAYFGRGIFLVKQFSNKLSYNQQGNSVTFEYALCNKGLMNENSKLSACDSGSLSCKRNIFK